jgi:hypothetical protein
VSINSTIRRRTNTLKLLDDIIIKPTPKGLSFWINSEHYFINLKTLAIFLIIPDDDDIASMPEEESKPIKGEWIDFGKGK